MHMLCYCLCCTLCRYVLMSMNVITTTPQTQDDNLSWEVEGSRFELQCRQNMEGARTLSKHCPGTLEQGTRPINAHTGSCDEVVTYPGADLPSPMWAPFPEKEKNHQKKLKWGNVVKETDLKLMKPQRGDFFCLWQLTNHYQSFPFSPAHFSFSVEWWEKAEPTATQCHCFVLQQREAARYSSAAALLIG